MIRANKSEIRSMIGGMLPEEEIILYWQPDPYNAGLTADCWSQDLTVCYLDITSILARLTLSRELESKNTRQYQMNE